MKVKYIKLIYLFSFIFIMIAAVQCDNVTDSGGSTTPPPPTSTNPDGDSPEVQLVSPGDEADNQPSEVELNWKKNDEAEGYNIQISKTEAFISAVVDTLVESSTYSSTLSKESTYFWRVSPRVDGSNGEWSAAWKFTTGTDDSEPLSVELLVPEHEDEVSTADILFEWEPISEIEKYRYQLALDSDFSELAEDSVMTPTSIEIPELQDDKQYYWRVMPLPGSGAGTWSEVREIGTGSGGDDSDDSDAGSGDAGSGDAGSGDAGSGDAGSGDDGSADAGSADDGSGDDDSTDPNPRVNLFSPSDITVGTGVSLTLEWENADGFLDYQIQVSTSFSFDDPVVDEVATGDSFEVSDLDHSQVYYWRVQIDENSEENWSDVWEFTTEDDMTPPPSNAEGFVEVENADFVLNGETFRFAGTNAYYLPNYQKIDPGVVDRAFDLFEETGVTVVRMWAFYDGYDCGYSRNDSNENVIQTAPGEYNEAALRDLDRVIAKGKEQGIRFILPFINFWDELGGVCQYNTWAGASNPSKNMSFFLNNSDTQKWYKDYIEMLLNRVNTETGIAYKDEPAIFSWQIIAEGRNSGGDPETMRDWYQEIAQYIKSIDSNHLLSTGEDGFDSGAPSGYSADQYSNKYVINAGEGTSYTMNVAIPEIDYGNAHWYPADFGFGHGVTQDVLAAQKAYISDHKSIAEAQGKPFILDEYGHPYFGDSSVLTGYEALWDHAEQVGLDGSTLWQLTADYAKCYEFGGNICYPGGRNDQALYTGFRSHIQNMTNSK